MWVVSRAVLGPNGLITKITGTQNLMPQQPTPPSFVNSDDNSEPLHATNLWEAGTPMDLTVKLSTSDDPFEVLNKNENLPEFTFNNITYGDWNVDRQVDFDITLPQVCASILSFYLIF